MRKFIQLILVLSVFTFYSCTKNQRLCCVLPHPIPAMSGLNNSAAWAASTVADTLSGDTAVIYGRTGYDVVKLKFNYNIPPNQSTLTAIKSYTATYYSLSYDGKLLNSYTTDNAPTDTLSIIYSTTSGSIYGHFNLKFNLSQKGSSSPPDEVDFTTGTFFILTNKK
jgi:hypothetical protein